MAGYNMLGRLNGLYGEQPIKPQEKLQQEKLAQTKLDHKIKVALIKSGHLEEGSFGIETKQTLAVKKSNKFIKFQ